MQCHDKSWTTATSPKLNILTRICTKVYAQYAQNFLEITTKMSRLRFLG